MTNWPKSSTVKWGKDMTQEFEDIFQKAAKAGIEAATECTPSPMTVGHAKSPLSDEIDPTKPVYHVADGVCGFAWINIKPGNCKFANWLKKHNHAQPDSYHGGVQIWVSSFDQSYERKMAYAGAFAKVIREAGVCKEVRAAGRLD